MVFPTRTLNRRKFLRDSSLASLSLLSLSLFTGGCEDVIETINSRPVRRVIRNNPDANHMVDIYRHAVELMKALPASDPRNWTKQAEIHQNFCPHGNWFFFPWHRVYLHYFEDICRKLTNEPTFALPYWDWCLNPSNIPAAYWGAGNALYDSTRFATQASVPDPSNVGLTVVSNMCNEPDFNLFAGGATPGLRGAAGSYGNIEATPHNSTHGFVGGDMGTYMSPLDPIFWNHHCMVDVCWYEWNILRKNANTNDTNWLNFDYTGMFVDGNGNPATMKTSACLLLPLLSFRYESGIDGVPIPVNDPGDQAALENTKKIIQQGAPIALDVRQRFILDPNTKRVPVNPNQAEVVSIKMDTSAVARVFTGDKTERVILKLKSISQPVTSDFFLRIFINKPGASAATSTDDPSYAGSFYFFTHGGANQPEAERNDYLVDVTDTLRRLRADGNLSDLRSVNIHIVGVARDGSDRRFSVETGSIELLVSNININKMAI